jgi:predicted porin
MQKKLIAAAVAGALATPVAIAEVAVSGSIRTGVEYNGSNMAVEDNYSRLRFKASSDLGNGQSAFMNYEFRVHSDTGNINGAGPTQRLSYVGIKGDWGTLSMGAQWSTLFNVVGTFIDKSNRYGGLGYWGNGGGQYRMAESVYLSTSLGGMSLSGDLQMNAGNADDLDRSTIGANLGIGGVSLGAAWQDNGDSDFTGIGASISLAGVGLSGGYTDVQNVGSGFGVNAKMAGVMVAYEESDSAADGNIWGNYSIGLGGGAKAIIELFNDGTDTKGMGMLRMDF